MEASERASSIASEPTERPVKAKTPTTSSSPTKAVVNYIVDQKGVGSESLVVKSAGGKNSVLTGISANSSSNGSRRGSSLVSPRRSVLQRRLQNTQTGPTTHTHPLFPNYSRCLPSIDAQANLGAGNVDLGLAALNVADFSLNAELWNASSMFPLDLQAAAAYDPYAAFTSDSYSIPRYAQLQQQQQQGRPVYMESTHAMNMVVSDLFSDVSMF